MVNTHHENTVYGISTLVIHDHFTDVALEMSVSQNTGTVVMETRVAGTDGIQIGLDSKDMERLIAVYREVVPEAVRSVDVKLIGSEEDTYVEAEWTEAEIGGLKKLAALAEVSFGQFGPRVEVEESK